MAAPVPVSAYHTTSGKKLKDGYRTALGCSLAASLQFWEKSVKPPGLDAGDPVDNTTMLNNKLRTAAPRALVTTTEATATVAFDPAIYGTVITTLFNKEGVWTIFFPDLSKLSLYAYLRGFDPAELAEGTQPTAAIRLQPTNVDPATGTEEDMVYTPPPGGAPMPPPPEDLQRMDDEELFRAANWHGIETPRGVKRDDVLAAFEDFRARLAAAPAWQPGQGSPQPWNRPGVTVQPAQGWTPPPAQQQQKG